LNKQSESFAKARDYAFFLLKFRLRSENELFGRLIRKKFSEETAKEVVAFLEEKKFIDDNIFAKAWLNSRLKRRLGLRRIKQELKQKGINKGIIETEIAKVKSYSEAETVLELAKERLGKSKAIEPVKAKRRVYEFLLRRGFSPEIVIDTLNQLCK
jgi:regulatory protein